MNANKKRANGKRSGAWITKERRLALYLRDKFQCQYCGIDLHNAHPRDITLDHLKCRCDGGTNDNENLVVACHHCNSKRGAITWLQYATGGARLRIRRTIKRAVNIALAKAIIHGKAADPRSEAER